jgi:hypothetical protein
MHTQWKKSVISAASTLAITSLLLAVRFVFAIGPMSASDGNGRCDWIDFRDALELAAKPKLD